MTEISAVNALSLLGEPSSVFSQSSLWLLSPSDEKLELDSTTQFGKELTYLVVAANSAILKNLFVFKV